MAMFAGTVSIAPVHAATGVPKVLNHQGRLLDSSGNLLGGAGTDFCFKFSLYSDSVVGAPDTKIWPSGSPSAMTVNVKNGVYNAGIGDIADGGDLLDFDFQTTDTVYLNIQVAAKVGSTCAAGDGAESFENLSPRYRVASAGYAINAGALNGFISSQTPSGNQIPVLNANDLLLPGTIVLDGATANANRLTLSAVDPTASRTINFPNASGTVAVSASGPLSLSAAGDLSCSTCLVSGGGGSFTTLGSTGTTTLGDGSGTVAINSSSWDITSAGVASGFTGFTTTGVVNLSGATLFGALPLVFEGATANGITTTFAITDPTVNRTITFPNASGTVAVSSSGPVTLSAAGDIDCPTCITSGSGLLTVAGTAGMDSLVNIGGTLMIGAGTNITTSGDGAGGVVVALVDNPSFSTEVSAPLFTNAGSDLTISTTVSGDVVLQPMGPTVSAIVKIGNGGVGSATPDLFGLDVKSTAGDPAGFNGASYYNASSNKFRCYENGAWKNCDTTGGGGASLQTAYDASNAITTSSATPIAFNLASGGLDVTGAGAVNLATGTSLGSVSIGSGLNTVSVNATNWSVTSGGVASFASLNSFGLSPFVFEGSIVDVNQTTLSVVNPTADHTISLPDASGTVAVSATGPIAISVLGDISCSTCVV
ncbi:MAG: hypothetical protein WCJ29_04455, partial [bacterium]